jgi:superfamily II DNA or RNA helicase
MVEQLRKHQTEALEALEKYNEGIVHLPTGAGKTMIESFAIINNIEKGFELLKFLFLLFWHQGYFYATNCTMF